MPTDKELLHAYAHGIVSAARANWMTLANMQAYFWSASSFSANTNYAWLVYLGYGGPGYLHKTSVYAVVCVR